ncbi:hypothetical protein VTI74DRAFT_11555 [Chaetomium olivicolor]
MAPPSNHFAEPLTTRRYPAVVMDEMGRSSSLTMTSRTNPWNRAKEPGRPNTTRPSSVLAPRFELPTDAVYSAYPEQGQTATHDTLPHVVFNDHMLPWERIGSFDREEQKTPPPDANSNRVPWLACLVFIPDELQIDKVEMEGIFSPTTLNPAELKADGIPGSRVPFLDADQATKPTTNVIFPTATLFNGLFSAYESDGTPRPAPTGGPGISRHRFLAHCMKMNTTGMTNADRNEKETNRKFSVLVANRVGALVGERASQIIVHVVPLENLESTMKPFPLTPTIIEGRHTAAVLCGSHLAVQLVLNLLAPELSQRKGGIPATWRERPYAPARPSVEMSADPVHERLLRCFEGRLHHGAVQTAAGEETAALTRGALTPNIMPTLDMDMQSNSGHNLKILDKKLGMIDLTYSAAWSLGRTLALADRAYIIALTRVRHQIMKPAADKARRQMVQATSWTHHSKTDLVRDIQSLVDAAVGASQAADEFRWVQSRDERRLDLSFCAISLFLESAFENATFDAASSLEPKPDDWMLEYSPPHAIR